MDALDIVSKVIHCYKEDCDPLQRNLIAEPILRELVKLYGVDEISRCITTHPSHGYCITYLDEFSIRMENERYEENVQKNKELILDILNNIRNKKLDEILNETISRRCE